MLLRTERTTCRAKLTKTTAMISLACITGAAPTAVPAQSADRLPSAMEVLERYVDVTGGSAALLQHTSMTIHGRYQVPARQLDLESVFYTEGGKSLQKIVLPNGTAYVSAYDGHTAWDVDPAGKVTLHAGDEVKSIARDADMYYHLHVMNYFRSMDVVDVQEFHARPCYHLKGMNNWGRTNEHFYDKETGLLLGYAFNTAWRGGKGDATETFDDYRDFGGVLMPVKTTLREGHDLSISLVTRVTSVTYDDVDDSVFALPDAVKKAVAEARSRRKS